MSTALVTGANRGIGLDLCRGLLERGWDVIGAARKTSPELAALGVRVEPLDVTDQSSIDALASRLGDTRLDLLVNNAGVLETTSLSDLNPEGVIHQFRVNALGPLRLSAALLPLMGEGSKIAMVTSRMGSIGDNSSGGSYGYRMSKAALNAGAVSLARDLQSRRIAVLILHPGFVKTEMTGGRGDVTPDVAASRMLDRIGELDMATTGTFRHANGEPLPW